MNLNETTNGRCKHGAHWTSPVSCSACCAERRGVWTDYGGYGSPYEETEGPIHCAMCKRTLTPGELEELASEAAASDRRRYLRAFNGGPDETEAEQKRLRIDHCKECQPSCVPCREGRERRAKAAEKGA